MAEVLTQPVIDSEWDLWGIYCNDWLTSVIVVCLAYLACVCLLISFCRFFCGLPHDGSDEIHGRMTRQSSASFPQSALHTWDKTELGLHPTCRKRKRGSSSDSRSNAINDANQQEAEASYEYEYEYSHEEEEVPPQNTDDVLAPGDSANLAQ